MKKDKNLLMFLMNAWLFLAYYTATHFNWWIFAVAFFFFPFWKEIGDWIAVQKEWRKLKKQQEIDQIEKEVMDERNV